MAKRIEDEASMRRAVEMVNRALPKHARLSSKAKKLRRLLRSETAGADIKEAGAPPIYLYRLAKSGRSIGDAIKEANERA